MEKMLRIASYRNRIVPYRQLCIFKRMDQSARSHCRRRSRGSQLWFNAFALIVACWLLLTAAQAQAWVKTGTALGVEKVRLAVSDFKPASADPQNTALLKTFNETLWNDLDVSGVV